MWGLVINLVSGVLGLWLADKFVTGVDFSGPLFYVPKTEAEIGLALSTLSAAGCFWGLLNHFAKPLLKLVSLPLRIITLNLFSIVISAGLVWGTDIVFPELVIKGFLPLLWTTLILWLINSFLQTWLPDKKR